MDPLGPFGLTFALAGAAIVALPFLNPSDNRARTALFALCIVLTWRYVFWRSADTLPVFEFRFGSAYAWAFSIIATLACLVWAISVINLSRTNSRSDAASEQR